MNLIKKYIETKSPVKRKAIAEEAYLFFFNDFLTIERFAEYHKSDIETVTQILKEGKHWNHLPKIEAITA